MKQDALTMRELRALAQERLGDRAAALKTRAELSAALGLEEPPEEAAPAEAPLITRDFFKVP